MSIATVSGYSMMYASQRQEKDEPAGPLSDTVTPLLLQPAAFGKGGINPSSKRELEDRYSVGNDFDTSNIGTPAPDWDVAWPPVCWAKAGRGYYIWNGGGWDPAPLTDGFVMDSATAADNDLTVPADEVVFIGRYPQTKAELDQLVPTFDAENPSGYFATDTYVCLVGQGVGDQYFWNGTEWRPGVSDD